MAKPPSPAWTPLARSGLRFVAYSAVLSSIKEIRQVMSEAADWRAQRGKGSVVFVDEIQFSLQQGPTGRVPALRRARGHPAGGRNHRKPSFEVNSALLSRCRVLMLEPLTPGDLVELLQRALDDEQGLCRPEPQGA
ncbi:MAG: hypothetical protein R3E96_04095 [Planctomycetota bacterium]